MAWNFEFPYTDSSRLNNDWILRTIKELIHEIENFVNLNTIKYADPIEWDITRQYEANTVVVDGRTGNAFISTHAVPAGVQINNTEYWTQIYNYADIVDTVRAQIATNEGDVTTASQRFNVGDWVIVSGLLYEVIAPMIAGDSFVVDSNIRKITVGGVVSSFINAVSEEATARENADAQLQDNIDAEATARENADTQLQDNIDAEATARENADTQLQNNIDAEATARENAATQLQGNIDAEATAREDADAQLLQDINNKKTIYNIIYDVTKYGAVGDGVADDTNAINNTIQLAANSGGGVVFFPKGDYKIASSIIGGDKVSLIGEGANVTKIHSNMYRTDSNLANATNLVGAINLVNVDIRNCVFKDFTIVSDVTLSTTEVCVGILGGSTIAKYNSAIATFENIKIVGFTIGVEGRGEPLGVGIFDSIFDNIFISDSKWFGMVCSGSQNLYTHCRFTLNNNAVALWHMNDESYDGGLFDNCIFIQNGYDITIRPNGGNRPVVFNNTWFEQSTNGIINVPFANTVSLALKFVGCMLQSNVTAYDMFTAPNIAFGAIVLDTCTFYQVTSTTNNNVTLPTAGTSLVSKIVNCVKVSYNGVYTAVNS